MNTQNAQPVAPPTYPQTKEVTIKLKLGISSTEDNEYFFDSQGQVALGFLADTFDALDHIRQHIITINDKSYADLQRELQADITS